MIKRHCLLLLACAPLLSSPARAQQETSPDLNSAMPRCGPQMDGQVFCKFGTIYECQFIDPNTPERRIGWRWKSDILRTCVELRSDFTDRRHDLPPGFTYAPQYNGNQAVQPQPESVPGHDDRWQGRGGYPYPQGGPLPYSGYRRY